MSEVRRIVAWYLTRVYGTHEGPGRLPYFADPSRVGRFAVDLDAAQARDDDALFRLLVLMGLYQSRRDVDIMTLQRTMPARQVTAMVSLRRLRVLVNTGRCEWLRAAATLDARCDVYRDFDRDLVTCGHRPRTPCHVKNATQAIRRMGDMGKLATSAWLHLGAGGLGRLLKDVCSAAAAPHERAELLVARLATIHRIGPKLAAMYVSALSAPELTPGFAPWCPEVDGSRLVVIDTNVRRVIERLRPAGAPRTYRGMAMWLVAIADRIDLREYRKDLPAKSPRLVQQALYSFRSHSNRVDREDACAASPCPSCPSVACPFRVPVSDARQSITGRG